MRKVCISFHGCHRSLLDGARLIDYFTANGWGIATNLKEANLVVLGLCGVTAEAERFGTNLLAIAQTKKRQDAPIIVIGCLAGINEPALKKQPNVNTITRKNFNDIDNIVGANIKISQFGRPNDLEAYMKYLSNFSLLDRFRAKIKRSNVTHLNVLTKIYKLCNTGSKTPYESHDKIFLIKIAEGCTGECSYCALKFANGMLRSKPLEEIVTEFEAGLSRGYNLFRLVAEDAGAYGQDLGTNICELLRRLYGYEGKFKLIFDDFSPQWLVKYQAELIDIFSKNCERLSYLSLPIQSGSNKIIDLMQRGYSIDDVKKAIIDLQKFCSNIKLMTHVIVGFPGENEKDFMDTQDFLSSVKFSEVFVYKYSDRPQIESSALPDKIPEKLKVKRAWKLIRTLGPDIARFSC